MPSASWDAAPVAPRVRMIPSRDIMDLPRSPPGSAVELRAFSGDRVTVVLLCPRCGTALVVGDHGSTNVPRVTSAGLEVREPVPCPRCRLVFTVRSGTVLAEGRPHG